MIEGDRGEKTLSVSASVGRRKKRAALKKECSAKPALRSLLRNVTLLKRKRRKKKKPSRGNTTQTTCCLGPPPRQPRPRGRGFSLSIAVRDASRLGPGLSRLKGPPWRGKGGNSGARWPCWRPCRRTTTGVLRLHHLPLRKSPAACPGRGACWEGASTTPRGEPRM
jgi:hypothetical protein